MRNPVRKKAISLAQTEPTLQQLLDNKPEVSQYLMAEYNRKKDTYLAARDELEAVHQEIVDRLASGEPLEDGPLIAITEDGRLRITGGRR